MIDDLVGLVTVEDASAAKKALMDLTKQGSTVLNIVPVPEKCLGFDREDECLIVQHNGERPFNFKAYLGNGKPVNIYYHRVD